MSSDRELCAREAGKERLAELHALEAEEREEARPGATIILPVYYILYYALHYILQLMLYYIRE